MMAGITTSVNNLEDLTDHPSCSPRLFFSVYLSVSLSLSIFFFSPLHYNNVFIPWWKSFLSFFLFLNPQWTARGPYPLSTSGLKHAIKLLIEIQSDELIRRGKLLQEHPGSVTEGGRGVWLTSSQEWEIRVTNHSWNNPIKHKHLSGVTGTLRAPTREPWVLSWLLCFDSASTGFNKYQVTAAGSVTPSAYIIIRSELVGLWVFSALVQLLNGDKMLLHGNFSTEFTWPSRTEILKNGAPVSSIRLGQDDQIPTAEKSTCWWVNSPLFQVYNSMGALMKSSECTFYCCKWREENIFPVIWQQTRLIDSWFDKCRFHTAVNIPWNKWIS